MDSLVDLCYQQGMRKQLTLADQKKQQAQQPKASRPANTGGQSATGLVGQAPRQDRLPANVGSSNVSSTTAPGATQSRPPNVPHGGSQRAPAVPGAGQSAQGVTMAGPAAKSGDPFKSLLGTGFDRTKPMKAQSFPSSDARAAAGPTRSGTAAEATKPSVFGGGDVAMAMPSSAPLDVAPGASSVASSEGGTPAVDLDLLNDFGARSAHVEPDVGSNAHVDPFSGFGGLSPGDTGASAPVGTGIEAQPVKGADVDVLGGVDALGGAAEGSNNAQDNPFSNFDGVASVSTPEGGKALGQHASSSASISEASTVSAAPAPAQPATPSVTSSGSSSPMANSAAAGLSGLPPEAAATSAPRAPPAPRQTFWAERDAAGNDGSAFRSRPAASQPAVADRPAAPAGSRAAARRPAEAASSAADPDPARFPKVAYLFDRVKKQGEKMLEQGRALGQQVSKKIQEFSQDLAGEQGQQQPQGYSAWGEASPRPAPPPAAAVPRPKVHSSHSASSLQDLPPAPAPAAAAPAPAPAVEPAVEMHRSSSAAAVPKLAALAPEDDDAALADLLGRDNRPSPPPPPPPPPPPEEDLLGLSSPAMAPSPAPAPPTADLLGGLHDAPPPGAATADLSSDLLGLGGAAAPMAAGGDADLMSFPPPAAPTPAAAQPQPGAGMGDWLADIATSSTYAAPQPVPAASGDLLGGLDEGKAAAGAVSIPFPVQEGEAGLHQMAQFVQIDVQLVDAQLRETWQRYLQEVSQRTFVDADSRQLAVNSKAKYIVGMLRRLKEHHERLVRDSAAAGSEDEVRGGISTQINAWVKKKGEGNLHSLLMGMQEVLWEPAASQWKRPDLFDMDTRKVKKAYFKACLIVHPDNLSKQHGTCTPAEIKVRADYVFQALQHARQKWEDRHGW